MTPTQRATFYMGGSHFTTYLTDEQACLARDTAIACWRGEGPPELSVGSTDGGAPVLVNLSRVDLIKTEEITPAMQLGVDYDSAHRPGL